MLIGFGASNIRHFFGNLLVGVSRRRDSVTTGDASSRVAQHFSLLCRGNRRGPDRYFFFVIYGVLVALVAIALIDGVAIAATVSLVAIDFGIAPFLRILSSRSSEFWSSPSQ